jgi:transcriptional regulator with XRE-family HTH domain
MGELAEVALIRRLARSGEARRWRERCGIGLRELAHEVEVDPSTLSRWERGTVVPGPAAARRWLQALRAIAEAVAGEPEPIRPRAGDHSPAEGGRP